LGVRNKKSATRITTSADYRLVKPTNKHSMSTTFSLNNPQKGRERGEGIFLNNLRHFIKTVIHAIILAVQTLSNLHLNIDRDMIRASSNSTLSPKKRGHRRTRSEACTHQR